MNKLELKLPKSDSPIRALVITTPLGTITGVYDDSHDAAVVHLPEKVKPEECSVVLEHRKANGEVVGTQSIQESKSKKPDKTPGGFAAGNDPAKKPDVENLVDTKKKETPTSTRGGAKG
ncbi:MAG: hypothetical protein KDA84_12610 [Planctomycetaceae bacterium]|nr:hypothetical protein [Planctomycetaceae bacterium]